MGYSARYHAASLAAVFFALAIGILIGSQYGGDVLNSTRQDLESSLTKDLDSARSDIGRLKKERGWSKEFGNTVFPLLVDSRLPDSRIGLIGFGDLPAEVTDAVEQAIQPSGASLVAVGAIRQPPRFGDLAEALKGTGFDRIEANREGAEPEGPGLEALQDYGRVIGRQLIEGGRILDLTRSDLMSQSSGQFGDLDGLILFRGPVEEEADRELIETVDQAVTEGAQASRGRVVGVETVETDPSTVRFFQDRDLTTVDNIEQAAGKVSLIYSLDGVEGDFGVKDSAGRLLPELLHPPVATDPGRKRKPERRTGRKQG